MSITKHRDPMPIQNDAPDLGARFWDAHVEEAYIDVIPQDTGNVEITVGILDPENPSAAEDASTSDRGYFVDLPLAHRQAVARLIAGAPAPDLSAPHPPRNAGRYIADIETLPGASAESMNAFLTRVAWHVRNGIPANILDAEAGTAHISEVTPDGEPPRATKEVRRHFRYKQPGDDETWHYHSSFRKVLEEGGKNVEFQRTFKSEWAPV